jgi:hypothetical protein
MKLGFTGTREGMTPSQVCALLHLIHDLKPDELHHGDCVGADEQAHHAAEIMKVERIVVHPSEDDRYQAFTYTNTDNMMAGIEPEDVGVEVYDPKPYLERNQAIVDECDVLVATPKTKEEQQRSGTWATVRMARKAGKKVYVLYPDEVYPPSPS